MNKFFTLFTVLIVTFKEVLIGYYIQPGQTLSEEIIKNK